MSKGFAELLTAMRMPYELGLRNGFNIPGGADEDLQRVNHEQ
ncbi:MAG TPA: hypothetical protein VH088_20385 [Terriglobales bacterium]|jgi:hypothetical protein|nr:hypothetical protein [Terriglobales bacterium]